jgi:glycosyltransferase involved in cell wall biosynthesis
LPHNRISKLLYQKEWVHFFHGGTENYNGIKKLKWTFYRSLEKFLAKVSATSVVSVSQKLGEELDFTNFRKFKVIQNSALTKEVDRSILSSNKDEGENSVIKIFWIGRFVSVKRPDIAIKSYIKFIKNFDKT